MRPRHRHLSTGIGVSIVANKVPGVRCAHCHDTYCAKYTRYHNDANMLAFGEKCLGVGMMEEIVTAFLTCEYTGGERHDRRLPKSARRKKNIAEKTAPDSAVDRQHIFSLLDGAGIPYKAVFHAPVYSMTALDGIPELARGAPELQKIYS